MNESHIKIEIDEELFDDYAPDFEMESFESLQGNFFTLKRFNLICEKVYNHVSAKEGIFSYIIGFLKRNHFLKNFQSFITMDDSKDDIFLSVDGKMSSPLVHIFTLFKNNKLLIRKKIKEITSINIDYKIEKIVSIAFTLGFLYILLIPLMITHPEFTRDGFKFLPLVIIIFLLSYIFLTTMFNVKDKFQIICNEQPRPSDLFFIDLICLIYYLTYAENEAKKKKHKQFHLFLSMDHYNDYKSSEIQERLANLIFESILQNENLSITINNSHPSFLSSILNKYQKLILNSANQVFVLKDEFQIIQTFNERRHIKFEKEEEEFDYDAKSVRFVGFPKTGNLPLSFIPVSWEENAVKEFADSLTKTKLDITKSLATELSHEIRNPIGVIQLIAENILSGKIENLEKQKIYLRDILKQTDRIDEVLKYFSSIETNRKSGSKELSINKIILDAFNFFQEQLESNSVHVEYQLDQGLPKIHGVSESLGNVLVNLIRNSIYALNGKENKKILVRTFMESDSIKIEVTDNGCGIDSNHRPKIFSPFFTTKSSGSGIGLWLSHRTITEEFSGKFTFTSEENKGTTFFIALPIERENT